LWRDCSSFLPCVSGYNCQISVFGSQPELVSELRKSHFPVGRPPVLPPSLLSQPTVDADVNDPDDLAPLSHFFLVYDVYLGSFVVLLWTAYLRLVVGGRRGEQAGRQGVLAKAVRWTAVGGPIAATAALLWEWDEVLVRRNGVLGKKRL